MRNAKGQFVKGSVSFNKKEALRKICKCGREFFVRPSWDRVMSCSRSCARKGLPSYMKGRKTSEQARLKQRISKLTWRERNPNRFHWNWIEDRSKLAKQEDRDGIRHKEWSKNVKNRDGWKCKIDNQNCNNILEAHHILSWRNYPELRYEIKNGITLCQAHHPRKRAEELQLVPEFQGLVSAVAN